MAWDSISEYMIGLIAREGLTNDYEAESTAMLFFANERDTCLK
jgi:hypothetical protein